MASVSTLTEIIEFLLEDYAVEEIKDIVSTWESVFPAGATALREIASV